MRTDTFAGCPWLQGETDVKIKHKLLLGLLSLASLVWVLGFYAVSVSERALQESIESSSTSLVVRLIDEIDSTIHERMHAFEEYTTSPFLQDVLCKANLAFEGLPDVQGYIDRQDEAWRSAESSSLTPFMKELIGNELSGRFQKKREFYQRHYRYDVFPEVFVTNRFGANIAQTGKTTDYRQDDETWWQLAKENGLYVSDVEFDRSAGVYSLDICLRIDDEDGGFIGVMKVVLNIEEIISVMRRLHSAEILGKGRSTHYRLLTGEGKVIFATNRFKPFEDASGIFPSEVHSSGKRTGVFVRPGVTGDILTVYARSTGCDEYRGNGWLLLVEHQTREVFASVIALRRSIHLISLAATAVALLVGLVTSVSISRRITRLRNSTVAIGRGDLDVQVDESASDEIGDLARSFNEMTASLRTVTASRDALDREITERNRAETELRRLATIVEQAAEGIAVADLNGNITFVNAAWARMHGYTADELLGKSLSVFHTEEQLQRDVIPFNQETKTKGHAGGEVGHVRKDGTTFPTYMTTTLLRDQAGEPTGLAGFATDISELKQAEEKLIETRRKSEKAGRELADSNLQLKQAIMRTKEMARQADVATMAKSEFLANMSHEIRTPMNGILGMTDLLLGTPLTPEQQEYLDMVKGSAEGLLTLLNDILDFSKIEAGKLEMASVDFRLRDGLGDALRALAMPAHEKGLELAYHVDADVPDALVGDPARLRQVVVNLIGNAVKFTEEGEVVLRVEMDSDDDRDVRLHFSVSDTGIGIPQEKRRLIFEAFSQADGSTTRRFGGTGLGLTISSQLVGMMEGHIWVESPAKPKTVDAGGPGSTFHFTARFGHGLCQEQTLPADMDELEGLPVLVVDDNATNRRILEEMLRNWRMSPAAVPGADEALEAMTQARDAGVPFRLILLDVNMPQKDGFAFAAEIRKNPEFADVVIIMLSSATRRGDTARGQELGIAAYRTKPVKESDLMDVILTVFGARGAPQEEGPSPEEAPEGKARLRILLAEDNVVNQKLAQALLGRAGHAVVVVGNGERAFEAFTTEPFDLVLMDVQMPVMDGMKATARIRRHEQENGGHIPIVAMTAHSMKGDRERCIDAGMDGYIAKPIQSETLLAEIAKFLPELETIEVDTVQVDTPRETAVEGPIDAADLLARVNGDRELLAELVELFRGDYPKLLEEIRSALGRGDAEALRHAAHTLKGAVGNFSAESAVEAARNLEDIGREDDLSGAEAAVHTLEQELEQLGSVLTAFVGGHTPTLSPGD